MPAGATDTFLFALPLAVVGGAVSIAHDYDVAAFGTVLMPFGLILGSRAYVFPHGGSDDESERWYGGSVGRAEE